MTNCAGSVFCAKKLVAAQQSARDSGVCADKIKKPADALKYFDIAVQKKYNLANAYIGKAGALKDLKKNDEYVATLKEGLEAVPGNKTLTRMYGKRLSKYIFYSSFSLLTFATKK